MKNIIGVIIVIFISSIPIVIGLGISFGVLGLIVKGICWAFKLTFSWRMAFGIWLVMALIGSVLGGAKYVKGDN